MFGDLAFGIDGVVAVVADYEREKKGREAREKFDDKFIKKRCLEARWSKVKSLILQQNYMF